MEFSDKLRHGGPGQPAPVAISPDGLMMATTQDLKVEVREVDSLKLLQIYTSLDVVYQMVWSPDSKFLACGLYKRGLVQVWSAEEQDWKCKIDAGVEGVLHVRWSPDSRHVLTSADFSIRVTVWSLTDKSAVPIPSPKHPKAGLDFSDDGAYMALVHRQECKDVIRIYSTETWQPLSEFFADTVDMVDLKWSPNGRMLAVWDSNLHYNVLVYSIDGRRLEHYSAYDDALGVKCVSWSPSGQLLSIGSYDEKLRILNHMTWKKLAEHDHTQTKVDGRSVDVYREHTFYDGETERTRYAVEDSTVVVPTETPDAKKPFPKLGVGMQAWSSDSALLFTRNDNAPTALWVWETETLSLRAVLLHNDPIKSAAWDPTAQRIAITTGASKLFFWSADSAMCVDIPAADFSANTLSWCTQRDGAQAIVLNDALPNAAKQSSCNFFCVVYLSDQQET